MAAERCRAFHLVVLEGAAQGRRRATMHPTIYDDQTCRRACGGSGHPQLDQPVLPRDRHRSSGQLMPSSKRYICIHGHFYQPPRENPWLETVETQDSAAPYHDWNERICAECYATNGAARIVNIQNKIMRIVNNYARISFNIGPTLLSWIQENAPRTFRMILDGESSSRQRYSGHSSAMAQGYNHMILPLASQRDRNTQIRWGIADYQKSFGSAPEGMWLPETAADT